jgi:AhpD family alkylhydroperoxidase
MTPRTFESPADAVRELGGVLRSGPALADAVLGRRLSGKERELAMVAVSRVNACRGCTVVHERLALRAGVSDDELRALELDDLRALDSRGRAVVVYAATRAEGRFRRPVPAEVADAAWASLQPRELAAVEAVARAMALANLVATTSERLLAPLRRRAQASGA